VYTEALYSAAVKSESKDNVAADLCILTGLMGNKVISDYMCDPFTPAEKKIEMLNEVAKKAGMVETSVNFVGALAENHRMTLIGDITEMFTRLVSAERGEVPVTVTTAAPLEESQRSDIKAALAKFLAKGETALLEEKVDESLLGGMVLGIGDKFTDMKYIDMSTSSKVKMYLDLIKQPV